MKFKTALTIVLSFTAIAIVVATAHADAQSYVPLEPIPGSNTAGDFGDYVTAIYRFALWSVGIAAMFMITIGGGMYLTSAGNTSAIGNAKNVITDAIIGLVLALAAWFLLNLINPDIINGDLSSFNAAAVPSDAVQEEEGGDAGTAPRRTRIPPASRRPRRISPRRFSVGPGSTTLLPVLRLRGKCPHSRISTRLSKENR